MTAPLFCLVDDAIFERKADAAVPSCGTTPGVILVVVRRRRQSSPKSLKATFAARLRRSFRLAACDRFGAVDRASLCLMVDFTRRPATRRSFVPSVRDCAAVVVSNITFHLARVDRLWFALAAGAGYSLDEPADRRVPA
jgi:hypothetical protein